MTTRSPAMIALLCVLVVAGTGCSSRQPYPKTWPRLSAGQADCRQFAGRYRNAAETTRLGPSSLTRLLFGDTLQPADSVTLAFPDARRLQIDIFSAVGESSSVVLTRDRKQFACDDGMLAIKAAGNWVGDVNQLGFGIGKRSVSLELRLADGYLAVKKKAHTVAIIDVVIPWRYVEEEWHRFERLSS
jgi:hypothetical protein